MMVSIGANGNVFGYNYSRETQSNDWWGYVPPDISVHGHFPFANLFEGNVVQHISVSDYWGPAGPDNTYLRNCVQTDGIRVYDSSNGQQFIGNSLYENSPIIISNSVDEIFLHGNFVQGEIQWDPNTADHSIPNSLYLSGRPGFYGSHEWPSVGGDMGLACTNPAFERWSSGVMIPPEDPPSSGGDDMIFVDDLETHDLTNWSNVVF
jgi:hypothetical protein